MLDGYQILRGVVHRASGEKYLKLWFHGPKHRNAVEKSLEANGFIVESGYEAITGQRYFIFSEVIVDAIDIFYKNNGFANLTIGEFLKKTIGAK